MPNPLAIETEDKDLPLREDIRLLGRILGDTVREQAVRLSSTPSSTFGKTRFASVETRMSRRAAIWKQR